MNTRPRIAALLLLGLFVLAACTPAAAVAPTPSPVPTATTPPSPTPLPVFAAGSRLAGVDVGGLTREAAREQLVALLTEPASITLQAGDVRVSLDPSEIGLTPAVDDLLAAAEAGLGREQPVEVARTGDLDTEALRTQLSDLAEEVAVPAAIHVISETKTISHSFGYTPGMILDVDAALAEVTRQLQRAEPPSTIRLTLISDPTPPQVDAERLLAEVEAMAEEWDGVIGFHLYDLATGEELRFHDTTVFAGASTIKVAIMLNAYINLKQFTEKQEFWLGEMIKYSDNISANHLLSAAAGGTGTEIAFTGAEQMSAMLADDLGLENLYLYIPYEAIDYIRQNNIKYKRGPKDPVGDPPYTETGTTLRATPYSIAQVYKAIDACANDEGVLLEKFDLLTPERCQEMLDRLATNADKTRMVAGVPRGTRVEHKSGWIEDMQADAGIVRTPAGDYVLAVYVYKKLTGDAYMWPDEMMAPVVAAFSRLAYTAYNPILLDPDTLDTPAD
ncbi:serine hydrolase [Candidatus Oscillochloris fontis]|uniref:serine hydrolase n=1 Tax=Candidatus Oscillochloris fontis TaxID=2496868 RepID=UPI00101CEDC5|nr:serine hydrolase [Candidatus Oscillochloris fontis]